MLRQYDMKFVMQRYIELDTIYTFIYIEYMSLQCGSHRIAAACLTQAPASSIVETHRIPQHMF